MGLDNLVEDKGGSMRIIAVCPNCQTETNSTANNTSYACKNKNCRVIMFKVIDDD